MPRDPHGDAETFRSEMQRRLQRQLRLKPVSNVLRVGRCESKPNEIVLEFVPAIFASLHVAGKIEAEQRAVEIKSHWASHRRFKTQLPSLAVIRTGRERACRLLRRAREFDTIEPSGPFLPVEHE